MAFCLVWSFEVAPEHGSDFERIYASDGDWAKLFARAKGYLGTALLADAEHAGRYLTVDRWRDLEDFATFKHEHAAAYAALDRMCEGLTLSETRLGAFSGS